MMNRVEIDNIVRVSSNKDITPYFEAIVRRMQPKIYSKYGCIKLRFTKNLKNEIYYLCELFWHTGLILEAIELLPEGIKVGRGVIIGEAYEATLKKIGAIQFEDNSEFEDFIKNEWQKVNGK